MEIIDPDSTFGEKVEKMKNTLIKFIDDLSNNWYQEPKKIYKFVFGLLIPALLMLLGLVGNSLSIAVLIRRSVKSSATVLLITMAVVDSVTIVIVVFVETLPYMEELRLAHKIYGSNWLHLKILHGFITPSSAALEFFQSWITVLIGIDR